MGAFGTLLFHRFRYSLGLIEFGSGGVVKGFRILLPAFILGFQLGLLVNLGDSPSFLQFSNPHLQRKRRRELGNDLNSLISPLS
uniref:Putative secreted protein n=1 Tax=Anopheles darlingi TaxID=43151 RepID=A0A2M4DEX8_ANODA